jgi:cytochrome c oxidase assembly factor CtaG
MRALTRRICLAAGLVVTVLTIAPPISNWAAQLFSAHMMQHLLLIVVAAPLLILGGVLDGLRERRFFAPFEKPVTAWLAFVVTFLFWHWPVAFQWAARNEATVLLEHATILGSALLFWNAALISPILSYGARALLVMTAAVATDLPGVIMLFAPRALCTMPGENAYAWGITPLEDQQIAGLLMWVPANIIFFSIATWLFALWISDTHKDSAQVTT